MDDYYLVWGENDADRHRHVRARIALLNLFCDDLRHSGTFAVWLQQCNLHRPFGKARSSPTRAHLRALEQAIRRQEAAVSACVVAFVRLVVQREWDWLIAELRTAFLHWIEISAKGEPNRTLGRFYLPDPQAPQGVDKRYAKGRQLVNQEVERNVEWWFRAKVLHQGIAVIGRTQLNGEACEPVYAPKTVRESISLAEAWLSLGTTAANLLEMQREIAQLPQGDS